MKIDMIWMASPARKMEKKDKTGFFYLQELTLYPPSQGSLTFTQFFADGEKKFEDTHETLRKGVIDVTSADGDIKYLPASSGTPCTLQDVIATAGEQIVLDVFAQPADFRKAGSFEDREWDDSWTQQITVLNDKMVPTHLTMKTYHDFEADVLSVGVYHARFLLGSRKNGRRRDPSFQLVDVVPLQAKPQVVNG